MSLPSRWPEHIKAVSLDFANTLYPLRQAELDATIRSLHAFCEERLGYAVAYDQLREIYLEIRAHQFTENRPSLRENDFTARIRHVLVNITGDRAPDELVADAEFAYEQGFIATMTAPMGLCEVVAVLSKRFDGRVAVCSNFIRPAAIHTPLIRDGLMAHLTGAVVSCEIGFVKPHPLVFEAVTRVLDVAPHEIVHIGDDWDADIIGATRAGMSALYTTEWRDEIDPFYGQEAAPLFEITRLSDLLTVE